MAMMMMSQTQDRVKGQAEQEERHQEFCIQVEIQCQQMQNQQNMMAVVMRSMMVRNASGSLPNEGIMNMFPGRRTEQHNDGQGGNSNTQE